MKTPPKTTVVHCRKSKYDVYIGRGKGGEVTRVGQRGCFGNPEGGLNDFMNYFLKRVEEDWPFVESLLSLRGRRLGCWCAPESCHGDLLAAWVDAFFEHYPWNEAEIEEWVSSEYDDLTPAELEEVKVWLRTGFEQEPKPKKATKKKTAKS